MMSTESFNELIQEIMSLGFDESKAAYYAARIGDTPIRDQDDNILVMDRQGNVLEKLKLTFFDRGGK